MRSYFPQRLAVAGCGIALIAAAAALAAVTKRDLTPQTMPKLFALIRPQGNEWRHLEVEWMTEVIAARRKAAQEDKPIVVLYTGGAGYNEPLGVC